MNNNLLPIQYELNPINDCCVCCKLTVTYTKHDLENYWVSPPIIKIEDISCNDIQNETWELYEPNYYRLEIKYDCCTIKGRTWNEIGRNIIKSNGPESSGQWLSCEEDSNSTYQKIYLISYNKLIYTTYFYRGLNETCNIPTALPSIPNNMLPIKYDVNNLYTQLPEDSQVSCTCNGTFEIMPPFIIDISEFPVPPIPPPSIPPPPPPQDIDPPDYPEEIGDGLCEIQATWDCDENTKTWKLRSKIRNQNVLGVINATDWDTGVMDCDGDVASYIARWIPGGDASECTDMVLINFVDIPDGFKPKHTWRSSCTCPEDAAPEIPGDECFSVFFDYYCKDDFGQYMCGPDGIILESPNFPTEDDVPYIGCEDGDEDEEPDYPCNADQLLKQYTYHWEETSRSASKVSVGESRPISKWSGTCPNITFEYYTDCIDEYSSCTDFTQMDDDGYYYWFDMRKGSHNIPSYMKSYDCESILGQLDPDTGCIEIQCECICNRQNFPGIPSQPPNPLPYAQKAPCEYPVENPKCCADDDEECEDPCKNNNDGPFCLYIQRYNAETEEWGFDNFGDIPPISGMNKSENPITLSNNNCGNYPWCVTIEDSNTHGNNTWVHLDNYDPPVCYWAYWVPMHLNGGEVCKLTINYEYKRVEVQP